MRHSWKVVGFVAVLAALGCGEARTTFNSRAYLEDVKSFDRLVVLANVKRGVFDDAMTKGFDAGMTKLFAKCGVTTTVSHSDRMEIDARERIEPILNELRPTVALQITSLGGGSVHGGTSELLFELELFDLASRATGWRAKAAFRVEDWGTDTTALGARLATSVVSQLRRDGVLKGCPAGELVPPTVLGACEEERQRAFSEGSRISDEFERRRVMETAPTCQWRSAISSNTWVMIPQKTFIAARRKGVGPSELDDATKAELVKSGRSAHGVFRVCLDESGEIIVARVVRATGFPAYDAKVVGELRAWKFRPYKVAGGPSPVCSDISVTYPSKREQAPPPFDVTTPPADAIRTASGVIYKKLATNDTGAAPKRNDMLIVNYTSWKQTTGEMLSTSKSAGKPVWLSLASTSAAFAEAMQALKKGEKAIFWVPAAVAQRAGRDTEVYELEIVDIEPAPEIPTDLKAAPADAALLKSGARYVVVRPGTGADKIRNFDSVTFHATAWDGDGRMIYSTEAIRRPRTELPSGSPAPLADVLTTMTDGERVRFWVDAEKMQADGKPLLGDLKGLVVYEVEVVHVSPGRPAP